MLEVIFYDSASDFGELKHSENAATIICPSPTIADGLRRYVGDDFEILTISKWVADLLKSKKLERINKAHLMLRLASVWRHYFPDGSSFQFFHSFELFTELRSFTLDLSLLAEFLKETDETIAKSIFIFWTYLDNEQIIDEHLGYSKCSDMNLDKPIWLIGFKNLSGIQLDMLKNLAERQSVTVFIPRSVYAGSISSDWTRWLIPHVDIEINSITKKINLGVFPKNKLNVSLTLLRKKLPSADLVLAGSEIKINQLGEIAIAGDFFKTQEDFLKICREDVFKKLFESIGKSQVDLVEFYSSLDSEKEKALTAENYLTFKALTLVEECLEMYREFQTHIDEFSLKIFQHVVELNSPRVYAISNYQNDGNKIFKLDELGFLKLQAPAILIASSGCGGLRSSEKKLNESFLNAIKSISPVKRAGLEFLFVKNDITNFLADSENILLIEEGLDLTDLSWREVLSNVEINQIQIEPSFQLKKPKDYLLNKINAPKEQVKKLSASRLQSYMDCPRKYYFSYVDKIDHRPEQRLSLGQDEMGTIEHDIIKKYFESLNAQISQPVDENKIKSICENEIDSYLSHSQIDLSFKTRQVHYFEILNSAKNAIAFLNDFIFEEKAYDIKFEVPLGENRLNLVGFIDCIVYLPDDYIAVFDFKRSSAAIGSKADTMNFNKVQIWVYLVVLAEFLQKKILAWGYINIAEPDESLVFYEKVKNILTPELLSESTNFISAKILELKSEEAFSPIPRNSKICQFCEVSLFCPKEVCK